MVILAALGLLGAQATMPYPAADTPLYLLCSTREAGSTAHFREWPSFVVYLPLGLVGANDDTRVVDPHGHLEGSRFDFNIRTETHWSMFARNGATPDQQMLQRPTLTFVPPAGGGETVRVAYLRNEQIRREGVCFGIIGANAAVEYEQARQNPSSLDRTQ